MTTMWGNNDASSNSVIWAPTSVNKAPLNANRANFYGNTTTSAYVNGQIIGQFGVSVTEMNVSNGSILEIAVQYPGSGYTANAVVTLTGNGTANATSNTTGYISTVNVVLAGNTYLAPTAVTIAAPPAQAVNALTGVSNTLSFISIATNVLQVNDKVTYTVAAGNTSIIGLTSGVTYRVFAANSTGISLSRHKNGAILPLTATVSETGHTFQGETAIASATMVGLKHKGIAHPGWVVRREGTGGRAGRVTYETLVAMGTITGDGTDNTVLPNA